MKNQLFLIVYIITFLSDIYSFHKLGTETFAARVPDNCHIPTLPRHGMGSSKRLTLERSHHNLIFAVLRPLDSVKNHNRIRSRTGNGVYDLLFTTTDLTSFKTRSAVPIANRSATSKRSLSDI